MSRMDRYGNVRTLVAENTGRGATPGLMVHLYREGWGGKTLCGRKRKLGPVPSDNAVVDCVVCVDLTTDLNPYKPKEINARG